MKEFLFIVGLLTCAYFTFYGVIFLPATIMELFK
jgi:hypothetical protein